MLFYFLAFVPYEANGGSYWLEGSLVFSAVVVVANLKIFNDTSDHSIISVILCFGSIFIYVICIIFADRIERSDLYGTG